MILERTPVLENLIESAMVKCERAVLKKKDEAIESLRLERLRPTRIRKHTNTRPVSKNIGDSLKGVQRTLKDIKAKMIYPVWKKKKKTRNLLRAEGKESCWNRRKDKASDVPDPHPSNPKPPDEEKKHMDKRLATKSMVTMECEQEERTLAPKPYTSQSPSTSVSSVLSDGSQLYQIEQQGKDTEKSHWEPPCEQSSYME